MIFFEKFLEKFTRSHKFYSIRMLTATTIYDHDKNQKSSGKNREETSINSDAWINAPREPD